MLNNRTVTILREICIDGNTASVEALAVKYGISNRMARYDLNHINDFLKKNGFSTQLQVKKSEITFLAPVEEREKIRSFIDSRYGDNYILSQEERAVLIIFRLLHPDIQGMITYEALCEELKISRSTLICDIRYVRNRLEDWNLEMVSIVKKGFWCIGKEKAIRSCIRNLLTGERLYAPEQLLEYQKRFSSPEIELYAFTREEIDWLKEHLDQMQKAVGVLLSDMDLVKLLTVILISVRRIRLGYLVDAFGTFRHNVKNRKEYECCQKLSVQLSDYYGITMPEDEIIYLMAYFISASKTYLLEDEKEDYLHADLIGNKIIARFSKIMGRHIAFSKDVSESFVNHVKSMIFRMEFDVSVTNPFLEEIKQNYPQLFISITDACSFLERYFDKRLSEAEIGYMVLYFQLVLEDEHKEEPSAEKRAVIVCASGVATGAVIAEKLKKHFKFCLAGTTSCHNIQKFLQEEQVDLIISSIPLKEMAEVPVVVVSPILAKEDMDRLGRVLPPIKKEKDNKQLMEEILSVIEENVEWVQMEKIKHILEKNFCISHAAAYEGIAKSLEPDDILLNLKAKDWREAIRLAAEPLKRKGRIGQSYITKMIETVEKLGAYIAITEDIAMPHAAPGDDIYAFGITIATFLEPVTIIDRSGIKMFITIAIKDKENYRDIIMEIMELAEDERFIELMYQAESPEEIYQYIRYGSWK